MKQLALLLVLLVLAIPALSQNLPVRPPDLSIRAGYEDNVLCARLKLVTYTGTVEIAGFNRSRNYLRLDMAFPPYESDPNYKSAFRYGMSFDGDEQTDEQRLSEKPPDGRAYLLGLWDYPTYRIKLRYPVAYRSDGKRWYPSVEAEGELARLSPTLALVATTSYSPDPKWGFKADAGLSFPIKGIRVRILTREATFALGDGYRF